MLKWERTKHKNKNITQPGLKEYKKSHKGISQNFLIYSKKNLL